ncbi:MAG: GNAT family N-acetyltransferase [Polyangia bacterium]|jgi:GNAT superfamily N-acetyltransferase|nr:GNAT family N-acetyltransferase [Polyangia bacterium]
MTASAPDPGEPISFRVRSAHLADHLSLCKLWSQVDAFHAQIRPDFFVESEPPARSTMYLDRIIDDPDQELLVAVSGDRLLGLIHLQIYDTPRSPVFAARRRAHVEDLVVDQPMRRRGVGSALLRSGEDWARRHQAAQVVLTVWHGNQAAEAFYQCTGYATVSQVLAREL